MARRQWENGMERNQSHSCGAWDGLSQENCSSRALGATKHRGTAPAELSHAQMFLSSSWAAGAVHRAGNEGAVTATSPLHPKAASSCSVGDKKGQNSVGEWKCKSQTQGICVAPIAGQSVVFVPPGIWWFCLNPHLLIGILWEWGMGNINRLWVWR